MNLMRNDGAFQMFFSNFQILNRKSHGEHDSAKFCSQAEIEQYIAQ